METTLATFYSVKNKFVIDREDIRWYYTEYTCLIQICLTNGIYYQCHAGNDTIKASFSTVPKWQGESNTSTQMQVDNSDFIKLHKWLNQLPSREEYPGF